MSRFIHLDAAEHEILELRDRFGTNGRGRFVVDCGSCYDTDSYLSCTCVRGRRLANCERCIDGFADHDVAGRLLCTACRDELGIPEALPDEVPTERVPNQPMRELVERVPSAAELDAELRLHAGAGQ